MTGADGGRDGETRTVEIPERTAQAISERIAGMEFESVDAYVSFALAQLERQVRQQTTEDAEPFEDATNERPTHDDAVEDRLESLGYL